MMKLEINRAEWLRGEGGHKSQLLREDDGKRYCLGFFARELGASDDDMAGLAVPEDAAGIPWPEWIVSDNDDPEAGPTPFCNTDEVSALMRLNDDNGPGVTETERESRIISIFAEHGVEVTFVDGAEAVKP